MVLVLWVIFFRQGRFLLAVISGFVLAQSFNSILHVGYEIIEQALVNGNVQIPEHVPEMTWKCTEFSVMLEHVQAHVAPTGVDPGAGLHWLPKILRSSPKIRNGLCGICLDLHEASSSCIHATKESDVPSKVIGNSAPGLRRTSSSLGRTWDEMVAESVATVLVIQAHSSSISSSKSEPFDSIEQPDESSKTKLKESPSL
ncbi:hypothetical protein Peur_050507 [Populus x canadensis]